MFQEAYKSGEEQPDRMTGAEGTKESMRLENSKNIDISVIMPVYNSGNYLEQRLSASMMVRPTIRQRFLAGFQRRIKG